MNSSEKYPEIMLGKAITYYFSQEQTSSLTFSFNDYELYLEFTEEFSKSTVVLTKEEFSIFQYYYIDGIKASQIGNYHLSVTGMKDGDFSFHIENYKGKIFLYDISWKDDSFDMSKLENQNVYVKLSTLDEAWRFLSFLIKKGYSWATGKMYFFIPSFFTKINVWDPVYLNVSNGTYIPTNPFDIEYETFELNDLLETKDEKDFLDEDTFVYLRSEVDMKLVLDYFKLNSYFIITPSENLTKKLIRKSIKSGFPSLIGTKDLLEQNTAIFYDATWSNSYITMNELYRENE